MKLSRVRSRPAAGLRRALCAGLLGLLWAGCAPRLTAAGARVQLLRAANPLECQPIDEVDGQDQSQFGAEVRLRNAAGERRANAVVIGERVDNEGRIHLHGQAFGCRPPAP